MAWYDDLPQNGNIEGYWKLQEEHTTRYDASTKSNDLYEYDAGAPVGYSPDGASGNCAVFTNAVYEDEYLIREYASCDGLKGGSGFTIRLWFYSTDPQNADSELIGKWGTPPAAPSIYSYFIWWDDSDNVIYFQVSDNGNMSGSHMAWINSQELTTAAWHEIWCVFDGTNQEIHIYADGTKTTKASPITSAHNSIYYDFKMGFGYKGRIDQAAFWDIPLTDDDILGVDARPLWLGPHNNLQII